MLSILGGDSINKMKPLGVVGLMLLALLVGFFGMIFYLALREGIYVPLIWIFMMLVVYLPVVSIVCNKKGSKKIWRRRVILSVAGFSLYGLLVGAGLIFMFH